MVRRPGARSVSPESVLRAPAVQALFFQIISFLIVLLIDQGIGVIFIWSMNILVAALLQGLVAAGISYWRQLASWWIAIQLFFPIALILALYLQFPPLFFLFAFLVFLCLYWTTFRTQVPFYPSNSSTWEAVASLLPQDQNIRFIDVGSGLGGLTLHLSRQRPDSLFSGIEIAPLPWLVSVIRAYLTQSRARFERGDYGRLNFADYDVIFTYLSPVAMPGLWDKARAEMRAGTILLSYEFPIPGNTPVFIVSSAVDAPQIYGWRM